MTRLRYVLGICISSAALLVASSRGGDRCGRFGFRRFDWPVAPIADGSSQVAIPVTAPDAKHSLTRVRLMSLGNFGPRSNPPAQQAR